MVCPHCGSDDINRLILNLCNCCNSIVGESRTPELDMDVVNFVKNLVGQSRTSNVFFTLLEAEGAQRFTDIRDHMRISPAGLTDSLRDLLLNGLVRMVGKKYQAIAPTWMKEASV